MAKWPESEREFVGGEQKVRVNLLELSKSTLKAEESESDLVRTE